MKNTKKTFYTALALFMLGALAVTLSTSFEIKPDLYLWSWFGYEFGLNFTSMILMKIGYIVLGGSVLYWLADRVEKAEKISGQEVGDMPKVREAA